MPSFLYPGWLLLLLILPFILLGAILAGRKQRQAWKMMVAPRLRKHLVKTTSPTRRWVGFSLGLLGCVCLIFALARPHRGETVTTEQISTRNIIIAIDTSRSMLVKDGSPDRMATAKAMAIEVLAAFPNDRVGIIAFSGTPVLMAPLTIDHGAIHETIGQLDTEVIPSGGSDLSAAVATALKTFKKTGQKANALILISDGEDHSEEIDLAAAQIRESGTVVCAIGVGKPQGGIIPDSNYRDGKFRDNQGQTVYSKMTPEALDALARAGRGSFTPASSGSTAAISSALDSLKRDAQAGRETTVPNECFHWFLIPAILLLAACIIVRSEFLTGAVSSVKNPTVRPPAIKAGATVLLVAIFLTNSLPAATMIENAEASYAQGDFQKAYKLFTKALADSEGEDRRAIQFSIGSTAYKLKDWETSNEFLSASLLSNNVKLQEQAHYNLGNSLFMTSWSQFKEKDTLGQPPAADGKTTYEVEDLAGAITSLEDSISHYQATLDINPDNTAAARNMEEAKKLLEQLKQKQQEEEQKEKESKQGDKNPKEKEGEGDDPNDQKGDGDKPDPNADQKNGDGDKPDDTDPNKGDEGDKKDPNKNDNQGEQPDDKNMERRDGETDEAYAARILKENSDAETRPVQRRLLRLRRPAKDW